MAVGSYRLSSQASATNTVAEWWDGHTWTTLTPPDPSQGPVASNFLGDVSCPSARVCLAVGSATERWDGSTWTLQTTPAVGRARLRSVSCTSDTSCTAVGNILVADSRWMALAQYWDGSTWSPQPIPSARGDDFLTGVSCSGSNFCLAVGYRNDGIGARVMAERWNGSRWIVMKTPSARHSRQKLRSVSCISPTACTAVGSSGNQGLAERWNGERWRIQKLISPGRGKYVQLSDVSCPSAKICTAVGEYRKGRASRWTVAERWSHRHWSLQHPQNPRETSRSALGGVDCPTPMVCTAVGEWGTIQPRSQPTPRDPLAERYS